MLVDSLAMSHFKGPDVEVALPNFRPHTSVLNLLEAALRRNGDAIGMVSMFWLSMLITSLGCCQYFYVFLNVIRATKQHCLMFYTSVSF